MSCILIDYYGGCHGIGGKYVCLAVWTSNEECHIYLSPGCQNIRKIQLSSVVRKSLVCPALNQFQSRGVSPCVVTQLQALYYVIKET